jgi:hypothetical protein
MRSVWRLNAYLPLMVLRGLKSSPQWTRRYTGGATDEPYDLAKSGASSVICKR